MRRILFFKVAGKNVHLPKLLGAFILVAGLLMFFAAAADMFDSWDHLKALDGCIENVGNCEANYGNPWEVQDPCEVNEWQSDYDACRMDLYYSTGLYLKQGQSGLTDRQFWSALLVPIARLLFWAVVFLLGIIFYKSGKLVVPIEESIVELKQKAKKKRKK